MLSSWVVWACPMCKDVVEALRSRLGEGYFWSVLFMVSMPFIVVGLIAWRIVRAYRRRETA